LDAFDKDRYESTIYQLPFHGLICVCLAASRIGDFGT
jgi:hypothetical protein